MIKDKIIEKEIKVNKKGRTRFNIPKLLPVGAELNCVDNSGAKKLQIIGYKKYQSTDKRYPTGGIGSVCVVRVTKGPKNLRSQWHYALIVRQKYPITRKTGSIMGKVSFTDNSAVLLEKETKNKKNYFKVKKIAVKGCFAKQLYMINKSFESITGLLK